MSGMIVVYNTFRIIIALFMSIQYSDALPDDYCLEPLNTNDCGGKPTPVFHYYKPGSRCEIKIWKGCPTRNKFYSEPDCSHFCIGLLGNSEENLIPDGDGKYVDKTRCEATLDTRDCGADPTPVYTYNKLNHTCQKMIWKGCQSKNVFLNEIECIKQCTYADYWVDKIKGLNENAIKSVLDLFKTFEPGYVPGEKGNGSNCSKGGSTDKKDKLYDNDSMEDDADMYEENDSLTEEETEKTDVDEENESLTEEATEKTDMEEGIDTLTGEATEKTDVNEENKSLTEETTEKTDVNEENKSLTEETTEKTDVNEGIDTLTEEATEKTDVNEENKSLTEGTIVNNDAGITNDS